MNLKKEKLKNLLEKRYQEFKRNELLENQAVDAKWRDIMAKEWIAQQPNKIEAIKAKYQIALDQCDAVVIRLKDWLVQGEEQYQYSLRAHKNSLEDLQKLAQKRLDTEQKRWEERLKALVDEFESEREKTINEYQRHVAEMRDITSAINHEYENTKTAMDNRFRLEKDSLTNRNQEAISALQTHLMEQIQKVDAAMKAANEDFKSKTEGKMTQFNQLYEEHKARQKEMKANEEIIIRKTAEIAHWRRKIKNNERESKEENDRLRQEKENLSLHFRELKEIMAQFRNIEARKLAEISVAFEDAITNCTEKMKLAEKILKYAEMSRKLETEREQVLPFPISITETDPEIERQMRNFKMQLKGDSKYVDESDMFDKFYRRYNKVLLESLSLQREKEQLLDVNRRLKEMLKKYIGGMGVSADSVDKPNTLVVVNQVTNAPKYYHDDDIIPVVDANLTIEANKLQGY